MRAGRHVLFVPARGHAGRLRQSTSDTLHRFDASRRQPVRRTRQLHLACGPSGGDLGNPARACAALAAQPELVTSPKPFTCAGGTFSWWDITITGRLHGRPIRTHTSTCWTPQMAMIDRLGIGWQSLRAHLLPRRREAVLPGTQQTFPPGLLRPADLVTCDILGHRLEDGVPIEFGTSSTGYGGKNVTSVTLRVTHSRDGSVTASCDTGNA